MTPNLAESTRQLICDMINSGDPLTTSQIAKAADCSKQTVKNIRANIRLFGSARAPPNHVGRPQSITPPMLEALCNHLLKRPGLYLDEMVVLLWNEFHMHMITSSISWAFVSIRWSKKTTRQKLKECNADL
jgi:transposase